MNWSKIVNISQKILVISYFKQCNDSLSMFDLKKKFSKFQKEMLWENNTKDNKQTFLYYIALADIQILNVTFINISTEDHF